ncbi:MAG: RNA polymerase sigma-70 factor [Chitinophaga sp.]|uniref:RNA polymerase sigma-70 factor n=1 Tax=Chitinophaga sp. TaxID=1869181 RepID=UPI001B1C398E|nr:RNA polymerase sigma-70 factor [Chitinophaga sp.]MBO9730634.1 RNA polymerase sigma-70 factor [Chitinophaga sp.]
MEEYDNDELSPSIDSATFATLFRQHYSHLCTVSFRVVGDKDIAKDIVQDFFLHCWNKRTALPVVRNFGSYAFRSVRNASLNYLRQSGSVSFELTDAVDVAVPQEEEAPPREELHRRLWEIIDQLPEQRRIIFLLSNRDGLKYTEIASKLNISVNTVKTHIRLAYQVLRKECIWLIRWLLLFFLMN